MTLAAPPVRTLTAGAPLTRAKAAVIMLHGRDATAQGILSLADVLAYPDLHYLAPQAPGGSWYPASFLAPLQDSEAALSRALAAIAALSDGLSDAGFSSERTVLIGFSQGGCLGLEYVARNARRYGAVAGLSAGLIGPENTPRNYGARCRAPPCSSAAAMWIPTSPLPARRRPPVCCANSAPTSRRGSIPAWATPSTMTRSAR